MATFVLVHGAWHASWCWERLSPLLETQGHRVVAPDLPGMGSSPGPEDGISLSGWGRHVAAVCGSQAEPVVLVGHSRGGLVISQAAEYQPDAIARSVYLAAFLAPHGGSLWGCLQRLPRPADRAPDLEVAEDGRTSTLRPEAVASSFYNTTSAEWQARAATLVEPEPMASFTDTLVLSDARFGRVPRTYIECTEDRAVPLDLQRLMQADLPCDRVHTLECDHSPFYSCPQTLAALLCAEARENRPAS